MSRADGETGEATHPAPHMPRRVGEHLVVPRAHGALRTSPQAPTATGLGTRRLRRLAGWLSVLLADDGLSARFAAERQRDQDLVRRVERRRRC